MTTICCICKKHLKRVSEACSDKAKPKNLLVSHGLCRECYEQYCRELDKTIVKREGMQS